MGTTAETTECLDDDAVECPACGCRLLDILNTREYRGRIITRYRCSHYKTCGKVFTKAERVEK